VIHLTIDAALRLYDRIIEATGGTAGIRDRAGLESALAQPRMTFGGAELYADLESKAAALAFSFIKNHPFVDGNKRIGFAAMDAFLRLNRFKIVATAVEIEQTIVGVADGSISRDALTDWVRIHLSPRTSKSASNDC
jgi:death-on-curing protein